MRIDESEKGLKFPVEDLGIKQSHHYLQPVVLVTVNPPTAHGKILGPTLYATLNVDDPASALFNVTPDTAPPAPFKPVTGVPAAMAAVKGAVKLKTANEFELPPFT
jgi:hypothetical protein